MLNVIVWLVMGGVVGWLASLVMETDNQQGVLLNVVVGIEAAVLAGWLVSPLVGAGTIHQANFSLASLVVSLAGALIALVVVNLFRRGAATLATHPHMESIHHENKLPLPRLAARQRSRGSDRDLY